MTSMIKAELYRLKHSNNMFSKMVCISIFNIMLIVLLSSVERESDTIVDFFSISITIIDTVIGLAIGMHYSNKTSCYEILYGNSPHSIILSKFVIYSLFVILTFCLPLYIILWVTGKEGMLLFSLLSPLIAVRLTIFTVGVTMLFKSQKCFFLVFVRLIAESVLIIFTEVIENAGIFTRAHMFFPILQLQGFENSVSGRSIFVILISFVVELILWYMLVYRSYKKNYYFS